MRPVRYVATAADVTNGFTPPVVVDYLTVTAQYGIQYLATGGGAGTGIVQQSQDDPFNPPAAGMVWTATALLGNQAQMNSVVRAFRVQNPVLGDVLTVNQQSLAP